MRNPTLPAALLAAALATPAFAQSPDRVAALEARMQALEAELTAARAEIEALKQAQATAPVAQESLEAMAPAAPADAPATAAASASGNANAFNPAISVVLDGKVASHSLDPEAYARAGFPIVGHGEPLPAGLSLGESEVIVSANVDDKFYGQLTLGLANEDGETHFEVEEAFVETTALPGGATVRMGRFLSNIGYVNSRHAHTDRFTERPLAYQALLGNHYGDDGVQLRWVAPTDTFLELSGEILRGEGAGRGGFGARTLAVHFGGAAGANAEWLAGVSVLDAQVEGGEDGFTGHERLTFLDGTWKWAPQGNFKDGGVTLRGEYVVEQRDGDYFDAEDPALDQAWDGRRAGAYVEAVYRINRRWDTGYRYDRLWADDDGPFASDFDPAKHSVMLAWMNSEFSLLRLQFSQDRPNADDTDHVLSLQYQVNFGAHGAHRF